MLTKSRTYIATDPTSLPKNYRVSERKAVSPPLGPGEILATSLRATFFVGAKAATALPGWDPLARQTNQ